MGEIEKIKEKIDIIEFINESVPLKKVGRNFKALCPFHSEKTPSFIVSPERQIWYCFGACNDGGDIFKFLMKWENLEFPEALRELAKKTGVKLRKWDIENKEWQIKERLYEINHLTSEYYYYLLTEHKIGEKARQYLKKREIKDKIIKIFMLGYAPSGWRNLLPFLKKKGYKEEEIEKAGLIIKGEKGYYDRFRGRLIFTLKDNRGNIIGFSGRLLKEKIAEAKYINTPETPLYQKNRVLYGLDITHKAIKKEGKAIVCEGEFDVLSAFQEGITNIVAIKGTALTENQLHLLKRYTEEILLALDMDLAGDMAASRGIELADQFGFAIKMLRLRKGKDIDEALQENSLKVKQALKEAVSVYDFILESALKRVTGEDAFSKKKIAQEVIPFYAKITNLVVRNHYVKKLAKELGVSEEAILEEIEKEVQGDKVQGQIQNSEREKNRKTREELLEEYLLSLIVQSKNLQKNLEALKENGIIEELTTPAVRKIIVAMEPWNHKTIEQFAGTLPKELLDVFNRAYLIDLHLILKEKKKFEKEFTQTTKELKKMALQRKLAVLSTKVKAKQEENLERLNQEFREISQKLKKLVIENL